MNVIHHPLKHKLHLGFLNVTIAIKMFPYILLNICIRKRNLYYET